MKSNRYRNSISLVYFLFCLFITHVSATSFIRQFTDDLTANMQQEEGVRPISNLEDGHYLHKHQQEISSRHYKNVSVSSMVKDLRDRRPSSYLLKMESFNYLINSIFGERYESRPFLAAGFNWRLVVYPKGNKKDGGLGYLSLYVAIDKSTFINAPHKEVYVDLRFYIFNNNERKYFTIQDTNVWRFNAFKTMWGFSQIIPVDTFKDPKNGYLYNGNHCEFGVDVTIPSLFEKSELFTVTENFPNPRFTWTIQRFSTLFKHTYFSNVFSIGGRSWNIQLNPNGSGKGEGKFVSLFLNLNANEKFRPYEKIYVRAKLRVLNQRKFNNIEKPIDDWMNGPGYGPAYGRGYSEFISHSDLKNSSKGFLVNDVLMVQVEMETISSTKYFPS